MIDERKLGQALAGLHRNSTAQELRLVYEQGATTIQVAAATGRSLGWVHRRLHAAKTRMRPSGPQGQKRPLPNFAPTPAEQEHTDSLAGPSATVQHHVLTHRLRELRTQADLTQVHTARAVGVSHATLMRAENPQASVTLDVLRSLCACYEASQQVREELIRLWWGSRAPQWWEVQRLHVPEGERAAVGLRGDARQVYGWADLLIPELMQTEGYARAIERFFHDDPAHLEMAVSVRLALQRRVRRRGIDQRYVVDETILRKWCGGTQAMAEQLTALRALAARGRLRVLSHASGHFFDSPFELCSIPGLADEALYFPGIREIHIGDPPPPTYSLRFLRNALERLWGWAEDTSGSVALIDDAHARLLAAGPVPATATT
ncbi:Scr1 family TA system antitoxin-like transcriptional regulator [Nocardiopsis alborubida]|uniref:Scr1 family TA system antitoxin-like transcriptional regulator n=1 Tax=Nocardiopsis alborubida TaxID=146802 RepID=UPI000B210C04|nr:Scr1 family TA system antitoxin-like transcriptional regulator [Nocardiopsis alborubida]